MCRFALKFTIIAFGGRAPPGPARRAQHVPYPLLCDEKPMKLRTLLSIISGYATDCSRCATCAAAKDSSLLKLQSVECRA